MQREKLPGDIVARLKRDKTLLRAYMSTETGQRGERLSEASHRKVVEDAEKRVRKTLGQAFYECFAAQMGIVADAPVCRACGV